MMSMTTFLHDSGRDSCTIFVNCAKHRSKIIFRDRLMASRIMGIDLKWIVETTDPYQPWTGYREFFIQLMLGLIAQDYLDREVLCVAARCSCTPSATILRASTMP